MGYSEGTIDIVAEDMGISLYDDDDYNGKCWQCKHNKQCCDMLPEDIAACNSCKDFSNFIDMSQQYEPTDEGEWR